MFIKEHEIGRYLPIRFLWGYVALLFFAGTASLVADIVGPFVNPMSASLGGIFAGCYAGIYALYLWGWRKNGRGYQLITHNHAGHRVDYEIRLRRETQEADACPECFSGSPIFRGDLGGMRRQPDLEISIDGGKTWEPVPYRYGFLQGKIAIEFTAPEPMYLRDAIWFLGRQRDTFGEWDYRRSYNIATVRIVDISRERDAAVRDLKAIRSVDRETSRLHFMAVDGLRDAARDLRPLLEWLAELVTRIRDTKEAGDIGRSKFLGTLRAELQMIVDALNVVRERIALTNRDARFVSAPRETITRSGSSGSVEFDLTARRNPTQGGTPTDSPEE